ncbi:MAG: RluA family pseudouridine synthase [Oleiphilaceae bacterium]|nr:RluA family pseudouridine synthase [Oleiphilaceae bacterium]
MRGTAGIYQQLGGAAIFAQDSLGFGGGDGLMSSSTTAKAAKEAPRPRVRTVTVTEKNAEQRIDNFLLSQLKGVPKSRIYRVIRKGEVRINKKRCKPETKLSIGDVVRIPPIHAQESKAPSQISAQLSAVLDQAILFEDKDVLAINKPAGLAVHGGSGINLGLIEALRTRYPETQFLELVHRLDRDTSGVILVAKSRPALRHLHRLFRDDEVSKVYHLVVHGRWPRHKKIVDAPLRKNELKSGERVVMVAQDGKPSRTEFRILKQVDHFTLLEAKPITGRTHQIRVHAAFSGYPIAGDEKYIQDKVSNFHGLEKARLMLHARAITFDLPGGKKMTLEAPYDDRYQAALLQVGMNA